MRRERITITIRKDVVAKLDTIIDGQKIRNRSNAIETIIQKEFKNAFLHQAVILAGGKGIEVNGKTIPKILLPIKGKTLIEENITILKKYGVSEVVIDASDKFLNQIKSILKDGTDLGVKIIYRKNLGTGSILRDVKSMITSTFLMMNGDILLETIDLEDMYNFHKRRSGWGTIAVATSSDPSPLGTIHMKGSAIVNFMEKTKKPENYTHLINGGVYMLEPKVCATIPQKSRGQIMIEDDIFPKLAKDGKLFGYQIGKNWAHLHDEKAYKDYLKKK